MKGEMLSSMLILATYKHIDQLDKSGHPYILHPLTVMYLLQTTDEELQCIALGHDLIEDTDVTLYDLETLGFSDRIVRGIHALTRPEGMPYSEYKVQVKDNPDAIRVKLCDLQHNMDSSRGYVIPISLHKRYLTFFRELQELVR